MVCWVWYKDIHTTMMHLMVQPKSQPWSMRNTSWVTLPKPLVLSGLSHTSSLRRTSQGWSVPRPLSRSHTRPRLPPSQPEPPQSLCSSFQDVFGGSSSVHPTNPQESQDPAQGLVCKAPAVHENGLGTGLQSTAMVLSHKICVFFSLLLLGFLHSILPWDS